MIIFNIDVPISDIVSLLLQLSAVANELGADVVMISRKRKKDRFV